MNKWQIVYAQWDSWASHDVIKHHIITTDVIIKIAIKAIGNPLYKEQDCHTQLVGSP